MNNTGPNITNIIISHGRPHAAIWAPPTVDSVDRWRRHTRVPLIGSGFRNFVFSGRVKNDERIIRQWIYQGDEEPNSRPWAFGGCRGSHLLSPKIMVSLFFHYLFVLLCMRACCIMVLFFFVFENIVNWQILKKYGVEIYRLKPMIYKKKYW